MYNKGFFINEPIGNNKFAYNKRQNKKLYVPSIIDIYNIDQIKVQDDIKKIAFEDLDEYGKMVKGYGLKNFYRIKWKEKDILLFDNHNHAYYFWYESRHRGIINNANILFHIDEHSDMRDPGTYINSEFSNDLGKIFDFCNYELNVGNYIIPAKKEGIIGDVIQLRSEKELLDFMKNSEEYFKSNKGIILNLDLDFFCPSLDYIDYNLKKEVILKIAKKAKIITVSSSPFFVDGNLALKIFKDIFFNTN